MAVQSPLFEFDFLAARARDTENAASAQFSTLSCSRETSHSCKAQQNPSDELTDCGLRVR